MDYILWLCTYWESHLRMATVLEIGFAILQNRLCEIIQAFRVLVRDSLFKNWSSIQSGMLSKRSEKIEIIPWVSTLNSKFEHNLLKQATCQHLRFILSQQDSCQCHHRLKTTNQYELSTFTGRKTATRRCEAYKWKVFLMFRKYLGRFSYRKYITNTIADHHLRWNHWASIPLSSHSLIPSQSVRPWTQHSPWQRNSSGLEVGRMI